MKIPSLSRQMFILLLGDVTMIAVVTIFGFATHGRLDSGGNRMLTTFLPVLAAWLCVGPFFMVYDSGVARQLRALWRPWYAMIIAAPLAGWLRGVWLDQPVIPVFIFVLGGFSSLAVLAWRVVYYFFITRRSTGS
jgi:hypothetical protein